MDGLGNLSPRRSVRDRASGWPAVQPGREAARALGLTACLERTPATASSPEGHRLLGGGEGEVSVPDHPPPESRAPARCPSHRGRALSPSPPGGAAGPPDRCSLVIPQFPTRCHPRDRPTAQKFRSRRKASLQSREATAEQGARDGCFALLLPVLCIANVGGSAKRLDPALENGSGTGSWTYGERPRGAPGIGARGSKGGGEPRKSPHATGKWRVRD